MENADLIKLLIAVIITALICAGIWYFCRETVTFDDDEDETVDEGLRIAAESIVETILSEETPECPPKVKKRKREITIDIDDISP